MKKFAVILTAALVLSCASKSNVIELAEVSEGIGKEWRLIEVYVDNKKTDFDRQSLARQGFGEMFTIKIDSELVSGVGAPNRYSAPYNLSEEDSTQVKIAVVRSTLMMPINEPEKLKEHEFFVYIQNTFKWGLLDGNLELHSKTDSGVPVVMKFSLQSR